MNKLLPGALLFAIFNCGCTHYYYVPNVQNVPLLTESKDLRISGSFGGWDESKCIELQTAYAAGKNFGIMADFMTAWGGKVSEKDYGRGTCFDGAIGYFKPLSEGLVFELYGGVGVSSQLHEYEELHYNYDTGTITSQYGGSSKLSFNRLFIQPSIGLKSTAFEIAISARTCRLSYTRLNSYYSSVDISYLDDKSHYFIEPALTLRAGWENIKLQAQFSYCGYIGKTNNYFFEVAHLSGGVIFAIPTNKKGNPD